jgi:Cys-tRNA(Pro)/Cys-tRNA(Cys) deacylase
VAARTAAIGVLERAGVGFRVHEFNHDESARFGIEAARLLGVDPGRVFKTLVVELSDNRCAVAIVPVDATLDLKAYASSLGVKQARMAVAADAERLTGYVVGGISPLGQRRRLATVVDESALQLATMFVSAGRRGLEVEIAPPDLITLLAASTASIARG